MGEDVDNCPTSHPSRGAWIEITEIAREIGPTARRTPRGVRGLKYCGEVDANHMIGRTPRGVRGLKLTWARMWITVLPSHPSRGAWIEIPLT